MTATITEAYDAILTTFKDAWDADSTASSVPVQYQDVPKDDFPAKAATASAWARVTVLHNPATGGQATLSGEVGNRRFRRFGTITVNIFTPVGDGKKLAHELQTVAMRAFEGVRTTGTGVIFRNVRHTEIGPEGEYDQNNVLAEFEYDEVR